MTGSRPQRQYGAGRKKGVRRSSMRLLKKSWVCYLFILPMIIYIVLFDWFPLNNILAWIGFIIAFGICLILSLSISLYITHKQDQEYQVLLKHYQKKKTQKRN